MGERGKWERERRKGRCDGMGERKKGGERGRRGKEENGRMGRRSEGERNGWDREGGWGVEWVGG